MTFHDGRVGRVLNAAPLVFVGWLSYSLYLWQQPFLNRSSDAALAAFPLNIGIVALLALISDSRNRAAVAGPAATVGTGMGQAIRPVPELAVYEKPI